MNEKKLIGNKIILPMSESHDRWDLRIMPLRSGVKDAVSTAVILRCIAQFICAATPLYFKCLPKKSTTALLKL